MAVYTEACRICVSMAVKKRRGNEEDEDEDEEVVGAVLSNESDLHA